VIDPSEAKGAEHKQDTRRFVGRTQEEVMNLLRSITRRGFNVGTAGWFMVLRANPWFPASRLTGGSRYNGIQSAEATAAHYAVSPRIMVPRTTDRRLLQRGSIIISAALITSALLWWIMHP